MCRWNRTSGLFLHFATLGGLFHCDCSVFDDLFVLGDRVLFADLSDSEICRVVDESFSFAEDLRCAVYFCRHLPSGFAFHMRCRKRRMPGIFACVYAHIDHMVLNLRVPQCV